MCSAEVWLVLYKASRTRSLLLSKIGVHWQVGAAWFAEEQDLVNSFPSCKAPAGKGR